MRSIDLFSFVHVRARKFNDGDQKRHFVIQKPDRNKFSRGPQKKDKKYSNLLWVCKSKLSLDTELGLFAC